MLVILNFFITRDLYSGCAAHNLIKLIVTWLVPNRAIKGKLQKRVER